MSGVVMALQKRELQCALNTWADWTGGQLSAVGALYAACKALQQRELRRAVSTWVLWHGERLEAVHALSVVIAHLSDPRSRAFHFWESQSASRASAQLTIDACGFRMRAGRALSTWSAMHFTRSKLLLIMGRRPAHTPCAHVWEVHTCGRCTRVGGAHVWEVSRVGGVPCGRCPVWEVSHGTRERSVTWG